MQSISKKILKASVLATWTWAANAQDIPQSISQAISSAFQSASELETIEPQIGYTYKIDTLAELDRVISLVDELKDATLQVTPTLSVGGFVDLELKGNRPIYFDFVVTRDERLIIETLGSYATSIEILNSSGQVIDSSRSGGTGQNARIERNLTRDRYKISVRSQNSTDTGRISLTANTVFAPPPQGPSPTPGTIALGSTLSGTINSGSESTFYVDVRSSGQYSFFTVSSADTYLILKDLNGSTLAADDDNGDDRASRISGIYLSPGRYQVVVRGYDSSVTGSFKVGFDLN